MKAGRPILELVEEVERIHDSAADYVADTRETRLFTEDGVSRLLVDSPSVRDDDDYPTQGFEINDHAHGQIAGRLEIPRKFYDRLRGEYPALLDATTTSILHQEPARRKLRTVDGRLRAFLSDRYRPLDNYDLLAAILPVLRDFPSGAEYKSCELTESRMYLQIVLPLITAEPKVGDVHQAMLVIKNSEVGEGALAVELGTYKLTCLNGMIVPNAGLRKYHSGRRAAEEEDAYRIYRDETLALDDQAFFAKVSDMVRAAADETKFQAIVAQLGRLGESEIEGDPIQAVEKLAKKLDLSDGERGGVLRHLVSEGDLSAYGLLNAVTREASDAESYDRAIELETAGGSLLALPERELATILRAGIAPEAVSV